MARPSTNYLIAYNSVSALLWLAILGRVILLLPLVGFENVYGGVGQFVKWTQTLALLEIVHSATGLVRSPLVTTLLQVSSRLLLVWPIVDRYPTATAPSPLYSSMLIAWSVTEVIRYSYFALNLQGQVPQFISWLRYNTFYILYPLGIASEVGLIWKATKPAGKENSLYAYAMNAIMAIYVPGSYILFTHMMVQRRKVIRGKAPERRRAN
ncbi:MAG: hypothetical protein MMC33_005928 [Icmadophila ericetorum]|nr:hypothetical protein [Icmadophila ericetorum]